MRTKLSLTGLRESIDIRSTVETALRLHPETEEIAVILDKSRTGQALKKNATAVFSEMDDCPKIRYLEDLTLEEIKQQLPMLPKKTLILLLIFRPDKTGRVLSHEQNLVRLRPHCQFPIYAVWQFYLGHGIVGGRLTNGHKEGRMTARMVLRILKGEPAADISLGASPVNYMFDYAELERFKIGIDMLPEKSIVINQPSSFYEAHKALIWQIVSVFWLLFLALLGVSFGLMKARRAERELRESEEKYRRIYENSVVGFFQSTPENHFINVNPAFAKMLGYQSPDDLVAGITDIEKQYYVNPEDRHRFQQELEQEGKVDGFQTIVKRKDGTKIWVSSSTRAYFDEAGKVVRYEGVVKDITESKRNRELTRIRMLLLEYAATHSLEELLRKTLDEAERLVDSSIGFYHFVESDQKTISLQTWSTATLERFCKAEGKGLHYDISQAGVWADSVRQHRAIVHNDYASLPDRRGLPEGHAEVFRELVVPISRGDRIVAILGVGNKAQDYTQQDVEVVTYLADVAYEIVQSKRAAEQQKKLQDQLFQAQKFEAIGTLAGGIAHDFNNLLMGIQGRASLISIDLEKSHPFSEHIDAIEEYVRGASDLTNQLLGFARGGKYEVRNIDINELLQESVNMFGRTKKQIRIHTKLSDISPVVAADRGQIKQVLLNLFVNAWQAMPLGGELYIESSIVFLGEAFCLPYQAEPGRYAQISVMDTGIGMDESVRKRVFDPFFTTKEKSRGTGLGLASAYGIVQNHAGIIAVSSEIGRGTTFNIYLPVSDHKAHREDTPEEMLVAGSGTILLVDDEEMITDVGRAMLEKLGYHVLVAKDGQKAIEMVSNNGDHISLVILDLVMPGLDGGTTFDIIREMQPEMPIILSSGYSIKGQATDIMSRGCDGFIQKPFNIPELSQQVRRALDEKSEADRA
jgi:PAS domain S-box-containing protein